MSATLRIMLLRSQKMITVTVAALMAGLCAGCVSSAATGSHRPSTSTATPAVSSSTVLVSSPPPATSPTGSPASADVVAAVTAAMQRWAAATTPAAACNVVSQGFGMFLGNGLFDDCPAHIVATLGGSLEHGTAHVSTVVLDRGQAIATATIDKAEPSPRGYYFVQENGVWKLQSIGERHEVR